MLILLVQIILILVVIVALGYMLFSLRSRKQPHLNHQYFKDEWIKVVKLVGSGEPGWRLAIIDADKLLDQALKQHGAKGESMADRLRAREEVFSKYNELWSAHKVRNRLVHEPGVKLTKQLTSRVLNAFQRALKELGALQ